MTPQQWAEVNRLFHDALGRPPEARTRFLQHATGDDLVRLEVEALLHAHESDATFMESPVTVAAQPDQRDSRSLIGRAVGPYRLTRLIGQGGMGVVYLAHDERLGRDVAIKALAHDNPPDPARRERLRREARAAAALTHPGIATIYALEEDGDDLFLVSEYIPGRTLREEIASGPLEPPRLLATAIDLTSAVAAAHAQGIIHRDLKPENVIRAPNGGIKVLDFGLARALEPRAHAIVPTLTQSGTLVGTPAYMAPEQIRGGAVDARADLFAVGVLLYELANGRHPFGGGPMGEILHQILSGTPAPFDEDTNVPAELQAAIFRCLEKAPDARHATAADLLRELEAIAAPGARRDTPPGAPAPPYIRHSSSGAAASPGADARTDTRSSGSALWWWAFHQVAVSLFFAAVLIPSWLAFAWIADDRLRLVLRILIVIIVIVAVIVRLHLRFVARVHPWELPEERRQARRWLRLTDWGFSATLLAGALAMFPAHSGRATVLLGLAVCYAMVFLIVEPATARAAFSSSNKESRSAESKESAGV